MKPLVKIRSDKHSHPVFFPAGIAKGMTVEKLITEGLLAEEDQVTLVASSVLGKNTLIARGVVWEVVICDEEGAILQPVERVANPRWNKAWRLDLWLPEMSGDIRITSILKHV